MLGPPVAAPLLAGQVPVVVVGWSVEHPDVDVVRTSDEHGMRLAVSHLVELGHRRIAHVEGGNGLVSVSRRRGYESAMIGAGLRDEIRVIPCDGEGHLDGQRAARAMLDSGEQLPTGIVAFNDDVAVAAMTVLRMHGLDVPGDVSIVGFDNSTLARSPEIDLTSITQEPQEMATLAVERLIARGEKREVGSREIVLEPELRVRSTTGPGVTREHGRRPSSCREFTGRQLGLDDGALVID
jgi:DNA-binding LacI/PurR family transcriptional regulator